ncbi:MAG TPA: acetyl-CoA carboxylase carboxyltransferase subunit alpha [Planctomycetota bacterium]|nr:acetyl-CoA carboxylase carboxyltransferase subunit alpha [Planctomycetota bacterium]
MAESMPDPRDFEKPLLEIDRRIADLESVQRKAGVDMSGEVAKLKEEWERAARDLYSKITPWQRVQLARDQNRPEATDYIQMIVEDFVELHGDKAFGDDPAIITGLGRIGGRRVMFVAQRKGKTTKERMQCNFGSPHPEGYRKALEKMKIAEKFGLPVLSIVNTPGAYPGIGAEERGQATIIARNLFEMVRLETPIISVVIGEGGSGGALGICIADRLSILENAYFSVISPEGCASILWRDSAKAALAAELLKLTPHDLVGLGIMDEVIPEPLGGAHRNPAAMGEILKKKLIEYIDELSGIPVPKLLDLRYRKYRKMGQYVEVESAKLVPAQA